MERHEAAMAIARINMVSKKVAHGSRLRCISDIEDALEENYDFGFMEDELLEYLKEDQDPILFNQVLSFVDTDLIIKFKNSLVDEELKERLSRLTDCIENLRAYAKELKKKFRIHPTLVDYLANPETEELLKRAVNAGILTNEYQPAPRTKIYQLKMIAMAIIYIRGIKVRNKWCHFEEQWGVSDKRLSKCEVPISSGREIYKIIKLYPEVDLMSEIDSRAGQEKIFRTPLRKEEAEVLFGLLKDNAFLDPKTDVEDFLSIQGLIRIPPKKINWIESAYSLAYFAKSLFGDMNASLWNLTVKWFTVNSTHLNHGTFKTKSHVLKEHPERYDFIPIIDNIIKQTKEYYK